MPKTVARTRFATVAALSLFLASGANRATGESRAPVDHEKILVPLFFPGPPFGTGTERGAFGSIWATELWMRNSSEVGVDIQAYDYGACRFLPECAPTPPTPPGVSFQPGIYGSPLRGIFLFVDRQHSPAIALHLRVKDLSRLDQSLGTEIPVARESAFRSDRIVLAGIPIRPDFRQTLRVYELDGDHETQVRIRVFRADPSLRFPHELGVLPDVLLGESVVLVHVAGPGFSPVYPGYAEVGNLASLAPLGEAQAVTLEIEPVTPGIRIWAFATVTQNETQRVTVVSPD